MRQGAAKPRGTLCLGTSLSHGDAMSGNLRERIIYRGYEWATICNVDVSLHFPMKNKNRSDRI